MSVGGYAQSTYGPGGPGGYLQGAYGSAAGPPDQGQRWLGGGGGGGDWACIAGGFPCRCEPEPESPALTWSPTYDYLGQGQGEYRADTTYTYVGKGAGEFGVHEVQNREGRTVCWCIVLPIVLAVLLLLPLSYWVIKPGTATTTAPPTPRIELTTPAPYDCRGFKDPAEKAWCCSKMHGRGCPGTSRSPGTSSWRQPPPPPMLLPADTVFGTPPPNIRFDCAAEYKNRAIAWSPMKFAWCCQHKEKGCTTPPPTTARATSSRPPAGSSKAYDCDAGYVNWVAGWSLAKKDWCCKHRDRACDA